MTLSPRASRLVFYVACILLAVCVYGIEYHLQNPQPQILGEVPVTDSSGEKPGSINSVEQQQLSALLEMNRLITTLGTTLMGALGFLLANHRAHSRLRDMWAAFASFVCVGLSVFYGYEAYQDIIVMLQNKLKLNWFDLTSGTIPIDRALHFAFFVLAVFFFADFAFHELNREGPAHAAKS